MSAAAPEPLVLRADDAQGVVTLTLNRGEAAEAPKTVERVEDKVGRNDPCPCGSGKKYKKCHGT